jgi:hypothetical protein
MNDDGHVFTNQDPKSQVGTTMADLKQLEFYVLRYVPYVVRGDFISIGVFLVEPRPNGFGFADIAMTSDWRRVQCLDRHVDIEVLQSLEPYIRMQLKQSEDVGVPVCLAEDGGPRIKEAIFNLRGETATGVAAHRSPPKERALNDPCRNRRCINPSWNMGLAHRKNQGSGIHKKRVTH